jgi:hypothetical protein
MTWLWVAATIAFQTPLVDLEPVATLEHEFLSEVSGIVPSETYEGAFWVHNDSGDLPRLFAIDAEGNTLMPAWLEENYYTDEPEEGKEPFPGLMVEGATNSDWESIALEDGRLYVADVGNNGNARRDLGVYVLLEPNPLERPSARILHHVPVVYPDQEAFPGVIRHFDCEAVFVSDGVLYFITKHRAPNSFVLPEGGAKLYRLADYTPNQVNELTLISRAEDLGGWVTAADLSPDGNTLAVLAHAPTPSVWLFEKPENSEDFFAGEARRVLIRNAQQAEAICFENEEQLLIANEQRELFRLPVSAAQPVR